MARIDGGPGAPTKVSVVIPTYDRGRVVGEAIDSALAQSHRHLEVIVVDDGSTDDTAARVGRRRHRRVRYLRRPHAGVSSARNAGIAAATGDLVAFLDSDDLWKPDKLEAEVAALAGYPSTGGVFSDLEKHEGATFVPSFMRRTRVFSRRLAERAYPDGLLLSSRALYLCLLQEVPIKTPALTVRRSALARVGGFDERWTSSEDREFLLRFARRESLLYLDRPLAVIRVSTDSLRRDDQERGELTMLRLLAGVFLDQPDGVLAVTAASVSALADALARRAPSVVFLPFLTDLHHDHWITNCLFIEAARRARLAPSVVCWGYEVWTPLVANTVVDIAAAAERSGWPCRSSRVSRRSSTIRAPCSASTRTARCTAAAPGASPRPFTSPSSGSTAGCSR